MKLRLARDASFDAQLKYYTKDTEEKIKGIKPFWAIGSNASQQQEHQLLTEPESFIICQANIAKIIEKVNFRDVRTDVLFTGDFLNDSRVSKILHRWCHKQCVDPPIIAVNDNRFRNLDFQNGRHRTKVACLLGCKHIPVTVYKKDFDEMKPTLELQRYTVLDKLADLLDNLIKRSKRSKL